MDLGINLDQMSETASGITSAIGPFMYLMAILAAGGIGRMVYVSFGDKLQISGFVEGFSGKRYILIFVAICVGLVFYTDREVRAWIIFKSKLVDPVFTRVLKTDSCNPETNRFCVVTWEEDGREIIVNWHDRRLSAFEVFGGYELTLFEVPRPKERPYGSIAIKHHRMVGPWPR